MDILYVSTLYPPAVGGAQIHLHCLAQQMQKLGHSVQVITCASRNRTDWLRLSTVFPEPSREYVKDGVPVQQLGYSYSARLRMLPWVLTYYGLMSPAVRQVSATLEREIRWPETAPDVVHVSRIGREFLAQAALNYARRQDVPFVLTPNHHPCWRGYLYRQYDRIYREADAVIALTQAEKELLIREKNVQEGRIHVSGIGPVVADQFSIEAFRQRYNVPGRFVLFLGQQLKYKGIAALLQAAPQVWPKHPDVTFVFAGPHSDYSKSLFANVRDPRIINVGPLDLESKTAALAACEMLCLPSSQESFGGVFVEAWSQRRPVIGGRIPAISDVIEHGHDGLLVEPTADEIAQAVTRLLSDPDEAAAFGAAGWTKTQQRYSWPAIAQRMLEVYKSCGREPVASTAAMAMS